MILLLAGALLLAGCGTPPPVIAYERPIAPFEVRRDTLPMIRAACGEPTAVCCFQTGPIRRMFVALGYERCVFHELFHAMGVLDHTFVRQLLGEAH